MVIALSSRRGAHDMVDPGVPLDRVAALAGHASLSTTARYTRPTQADLERAVEALEWA
jgi:site-specific recombinase XerD